MRATKTKTLGEVRDAVMEKNPKAKEEWDKPKAAKATSGHLDKVESVSDMPKNAVGHNSNSKAKDELTKKYVSFVATRLREIKNLRDEIKEEMVSAKQDGCDATAIRKAAKFLDLSDEQRIAQEEEQAEIERITEMCRDLPLFKAA